MIKALILLGLVPFLVLAAIGCLRMVAALEWLERIDQE